MERKKVQVGRDHVQRLIAASPQKAIEELLWNALDAGGDRVEADLTLNELGAVQCIKVTDRGPGIHPADLDRAFGSIGNSIKAEKKVNPDNRTYHGREGKGRFKALTLCPAVIWRTTYDDTDTRNTYSIHVTREDPEYYQATDPEACASEFTGTEVILAGLDKGHLALSRDEIRDRLAENFASYLTSYPGVQLVWDGLPVQINDLICRQEAIDLLDADDNLAPASLLVIEWRFKPDNKRIHICDTDGFSYHDILAGVQGRGIEYTAYIRTPRARGWAESGRFATDALDDEIGRLIDAAKDRLREYIRARLVV